MKTAQLPPPSKEKIMFCCDEAWVPWYLRTSVPSVVHRGGTIYSTVQKYITVGRRLWEMMKLVYLATEVQPLSALRRRKTR